MSCRVLLSLALGALLLPTGTGLVCALAARVAGAGRLEVAGLLLLSLASLVRASTSPPEPGSTPTAGTPAAVRLVGRWRVPPGTPPHLETAAGPVALSFAEDLAEPAPGTPIEVLARCTDGDRALAVVLRVQGPARGAWLDRWARRVAGRIRRLARGERQGLVEALVLGRRQDLEAAIARDCRRSGTMHLLALSGLHVALAAGLLASAAAASGLGHDRLLVAVLGLFVLLAGARPPLVRALLAWIVLRAGRAHGRAADGLYRLGVVALVVGAGAPPWIDDLGARLSFLAVGGLLAAHRLGGPLAAPWGAYGATAPLCAEVFGLVQPWGVVVTPLLVPLVAAVLALGLAAALPGPALSALDGVAAPLLDGAAGLLRWALAQAAHHLPAPLHPAPLPGGGTALGLLVIGLLVGLGRRRSPA